jgi:aspartate racemase
MHKTIGLLGGMSPESTVEYYRYITRTYTERFGDYSYPPILIHSVSFQPYVDWPNQGRWDLVGKGLSEAARHLEAGGAEFIVIATNTMHIVVDEVKAGVGIPVLSLLEVVGEAALNQGMQTVGLLGTQFTMEHGFYQNALNSKGIEVLVPGEDDRRFINDTIYNELVKGIIQDEARERFVEIVGELAGRGAQGVILGCTEIPLLIGEGDVEVPLLDTTTLHAEAALQYAIDT